MVAISGSKDTLCCRARSLLTVHQGTEGCDGFAVDHAEAQGQAEGERPAAPRCSPSEVLPSLPMPHRERLLCCLLCINYTTLPCHHGPFSIVFNAAER